MPPRKRSAPPSDDQPIAIRPKVEHTFSPLFDNKENDADLILVSSSDPPVSFAVRRVALELHSSALSFPKVKAEGSSSKKDMVIEVVNIEAESKALEILLRYLIPKSYLDLDGVAPKFTPFRSAVEVDLLATVLGLATSYQCSSILDDISKQHLPLLFKRVRWRDGPSHVDLDDWRKLEKLSAPSRMFEYSTQAQSGTT